MAEAGVDQTARTGSDAVVSGRDSDDPGGAVLDHTWRQVGGPDVELIPVTTSTVRFRVPRLLQETPFEPARVGWMERSAIHQPGI